MDYIIILISSILIARAIIWVMCRIDKMAVNIVQIAADLKAKKAADNEKVRQAITLNMTSGKLAFIGNRAIFYSAVGARKIYHTAYLVNDDLSEFVDYIKLCKDCEDTYQRNHANSCDYSKHLRFTACLRSNYYQNHIHVRFTDGRQVTFKLIANAVKQCNISVSPAPKNAARIFNYDGYENAFNACVCIEGVYYDANLKPLTKSILKFPPLCYRDGDYWAEQQLKGPSVVIGGYIFARTAKHLIISKGAINLTASMGGLPFIAIKQMKRKKSTLYYFINDRTYIMARLIKIDNTREYSIIFGFIKLLLTRDYQIINVSRCKWLEYINYIAKVIPEITRVRM